MEVGGRIWYSEAGLEVSRQEQVILKVCNGYAQPEREHSIQDPGVTFFSYPGYYKTIVDNIGIVNGIECSNRRRILKEDMFGSDFLGGYLGEYMWVFYLGVGLNVFCVSFMMILVFAPGLAKWLMVKGMKLLEHFRFLKPRKSRLEKLENSMDQYHATAAFWAGHKLVILKVFLITFVQRIILFTVTYWVYRSLGFHEYGIVTLTILQSVISVSVDMLPLPGGMGISESLYLVIFAPVFGETLLPAMLLSRGISYYAQMLISAVMTCVAHLVIGRKVQEENRG